MKILAQFYCWLIVLTLLSIPDGIANEDKVFMSREIIYRLNWFELQVSPDAFRFAAVPQQPILLTKEESDGQPGAVLLIRKDNAPQLFDQIYEKLEQLISEYKIESLPMNDPEKCFADTTVDAPSIHLRFAYADGKKWAAYYPLDNVPDDVNDLIQECRVLAYSVFKEREGEKISYQKAQEYLEKTSNEKRKSHEDIIVKIKIKSSGDIMLNARQVSLEELWLALDELALAGGSVWYYRENPLQKPSAQVEQVVKVVIDEIVKRKLPVKLSETDFL